MHPKGEQAINKLQLQITDFIISLRVPWAEGAKRIVFDTKWRIAKSLQCGRCLFVNTHHKHLFVQAKRSQTFEHVQRIKQVAIIGDSGHDGMTIF